MMKLELLNARMSTLRGRNNAQADVLDSLHQYLLNRPEVMRLYPHGLARDLDLSLDSLMYELLHGVAEGVFDLHWDIRCPHCGNLVKDYRHLDEAMHTEHCALCVVDYEVDFAANVEVTFSLNDEIYEDDMIGATKRPDDVSILTGLDMMHYPVFRDIFRDEVLSRREQLKITAVTLLFTDITGSTQMYEKLGDTVAYNIVRDHFDILFDEIQSHHGIVIKTIGDAVMASFRSNEDAVSCVLNGMGRFEEYNKERELDEQVRIKVGLHRGPAILVTLNDRLDYFGSTVNKAARIQGYAGSNEFLVSEEVYETPGVREALTEQDMLHIRPLSLDLKGLEGQHKVYSLSFDEIMAEGSAGLWDRIKQSIGL